jgi:hypothetical protein
MAIKKKSAELPIKGTFQDHGTHMAYAWAPLERGLYENDPDYRQRLHAAIKAVSGWTPPGGVIPGSKMANPVLVFPKITIDVI